MKPSVLVVDDHDATRFVLSRILTGLGVDVSVADDGADVAELVTRQRFDLLVVDLYMGGMNGFELLRQVRRPQPGQVAVSKTLSNVPIVVVSGEAAAASIANAKRLGADAYLVKPVDVDEFERVVRQLMRAAPTGHDTRGV